MSFFFFSLDPQSHKEIIDGTEKDMSIKQTKKKKFDVINEAGGKSFLIPVLTGQWFAMNADIFIFTRLTNPRPIESQGGKEKWKNSL